MNGIHDMGGMHGFGPIQRDDAEPPFHHEWERRVFAMRVASPIPIPGGSRNNIEQMSPADYLNTSYYEKWLQSRLKGFIDAGVLTEAEVEARMAEFRQQPALEVVAPESSQTDDVQAAMTRLLTWNSPRHDGTRAPQFALGDQVRIRNFHPPGHTRLPQYARGKQGEVVRYYGLYDVQDTMPTGVEPPVEPLYAVRFAAEELWGPSAEPNSVLYLDMWESYLEAM